VRLCPIGRKSRIQQIPQQWTGEAVNSSGFHRWRCPGALLLALASAPAGAGEAPSERDYLADEPVVLSASRLAQPRSRTPAAVTVITREMIEASGFRQLVDVLRLVPGFLVGWSGGNTPAATYLGLSDAFPHWMQVMVDGRSVYNPAYGQTNWRGLPLSLDDVERIEVVRGPNAANDGLNSMIGTIHIYTRHSATTGGEMAELVAGDHLTRELDVRHGAIGEGGSWRLSAVGREDERHAVAHDRAEDRMLSYRGDFRATVQDSLMLELGMARGRWQGTNVGQLAYDDQHAVYQNAYGNLLWTHSIGEGREWSLQVDHTYDQNREAIPLPAPLDPVSGDFRTTISAIALSFLDKSASEWRHSESVELRSSAVQLPGLFASNGYRTDEALRVSGALEWNPSQDFVANAGAMLERHTDTGRVDVSPRLSLNWLPDHDDAFRLGLSRGTSSLELYGNNTDIRYTIGGVLADQVTLSTRKLAAEKIDNLELGYLLNKPALGLSVDARVYHDRLFDLAGLESIAFPSDPTDGRTDTYVTKDSISIDGLEFQATWHSATGAWLSLSQSWISRSNSVPAFHARAIPHYSTSLVAALPFETLRWTAGWYHVDRVQWISGGYDSQYHRVDLGVEKDWPLAGGSLATSLVLQSLVGSEDESFSEYLYKHQRFEHRGYLRLRYDFR
jgi:iron complex outermembrane recepter protein